MKAWEGKVTRKIIIHCKLLPLQRLVQQAMQPLDILDSDSWKKISTQKKTCLPDLKENIYFCADFWVREREREREYNLCQNVNAQWFDQIKMRSITLFQSSRLSDPADDPDWCTKHTTWVVFWSILLLEMKRKESSRRRFNLSWKHIAALHQFLPTSWVVHSPNSFGIPVPDKPGSYSKRNTEMNLPEKDLFGPMAIPRKPPNWHCEKQEKCYWDDSYLASALNYHDLLCRHRSKSIFRATSTSSMLYDMIGIYSNARQCTAMKSKARQNPTVPGASRQQTTKKTARYN